MASTYLSVFFSVDGAPSTGLASTQVSAIRLSDGATVLSGQALTEQGLGFYAYLWAAYDPAEQYLFLYDAGTDSVDARYIPAANENSLSDLESSLALEASVQAIPTNPVLDNDARLDNLDAAVSSRSSFDHTVDEVITDAASRTASQADVSTLALEATVAAIPTNPVLDNDARLDNLDAAVSSRSTFDATTDQVLADVREVNDTAVAGVDDFKADVSALATEATVDALRKLAEADAVFDNNTGLLHLYERGTTTDLVPPKTVSGTNVGQTVEVQE